jgi:hypothetical protein
MVQAIVLGEWIGIEDARPQQGPAFFRFHRQIQLGKIGPTPLFHVAQVQKEGQDARTALAIHYNRMEIAYQESGIDKVSIRDPINSAVAKTYLGGE